MLRINRRKMIGLLLLSVSAIVYVFALGSGQDSIFEYTLLLACLTFALLLNNDFELISPAVLFTAYFLYSIALGPIGLKPVRMSHCLMAYILRKIRHFAKNIWVNIRLYSCH